MAASLVSASKTDLKVEVVNANYHVLNETETFLVLSNTKSAKSSFSNQMSMVSSFKSFVQRRI